MTRNKGLNKGGTRAELTVTRGEPGLTRADVTRGREPNKGDVMSKKDYDLIAAAVRAARNRVNAELTGGDNLVGRDVLDWVTAELELSMQVDNPRFNPERFRVACGQKPREGT